MPPRPKIAQLPPELRDWLDQELVRRGFGDYTQLAADLKREAAARGQRAEVGKSAVQVYGKNLERRLSAIRASTEAARAIADAAPDDADQRSAAVISLIQTEIFDTLIQLQEAGDENVDPVQRAKILSNVAKNAATLSRASVNQKKHELEIRARVSAAAESVSKIAAAGGASKATVAELRREILGIAS